MMLLERRGVPGGWVELRRRAEQTKKTSMNATPMPLTSIHAGTGPLTLTTYLI
jgi:hypothetical protein